jgi:dipeptidyl aminopeptidase/acylaminoacyl peptidase
MTSEAPPGQRLAGEPLAQTATVAPTWRSNLACASGAWSPSLSPDGASIAYVSDRDGVPGVWVLRRRDRRAARLDTGTEQVQQVRWSVDGCWLAVLLAPGGSSRTFVRVIRPDGSERHAIGEADGATMLGPWTHQPGVLAVSLARARQAESFAAAVDVQTGHRTLLATGGHLLALDLDRCNRVALVRRGPRGARTVWAVDLATGFEQQLVPAGGVGSTDLGRLSPDALVAYVRSDAGRETHALFAVELATASAPQRATVLAERSGADLEHVDLTADGTVAVLLWNCGGRSVCDRVDLATGRRVELPLPEPVAHDCSFSRDGRWLVMTLEGPTHPRAVWLLDAGQGTWERITSQRAGWSAPVASPCRERLRADDGLELDGWLYQARPEGQRPGAALLYLHGGPEWQERPVYSPLFQELVARGIAVFAPNVRGSSGFGRSFVDADNREKRWGAITDVASCARHLVDRGVAAPGRIACGGRSYGGYLTLAALVFHPELFAAGVDICGIADFHTFYENTEPWIAEAAYPKYGHPVHDGALLRALSPIHRFDALRAPLLVVHGANDSNVPVEEAEQVLAAARSRGVSVDYLLIADEGHEIAAIDNRETFVRTTVDWLVARLL